MTLYRESFGLAKDPFNMTPDPELLFMTEQHREALAGVAYAILDHKGFIALIGPAGTGKTTLVTKVLRSFKNLSVQSSVILNPALSPAEFLEMVLLDFGMKEVPGSKAQRIYRFHELLLEAHRQNKISALIVDEAHKLSPEVLEEIRLWSNFEFSDQKLLQIVLVGQPELRNVLNREDLRQFKQRIALRFTIAPLAPEEIEAYVQHRWSECGGSAPMPVTREAIDLIARASGGIPRVINAICDNALLLIFGRGVATVGEEHVLDACRDLDILPAPSSPVLVTVAVNGHSNGSNGNVMIGKGNGLPSTQVFEIVQPAAKEPEVSSLRTLAAYEPTAKRSVWKRLWEKKLAGAR